jgi:hypothetical protein
MFHVKHFGTNGRLRKRTRAKRDDGAKWGFCAGGYNRRRGHEMQGFDALMARRRTAPASFLATKELIFLTVASRQQTLPRNQDTLQPIRVTDATLAHPAVRRSRGVMLRRQFLAGVAVCHLSLGACATLPPLEEATGGIPVREIVLRTKCELSDAFVASDGTWLPDHAKFAWLKNWTAQVDLTLQILDTATLSPGASLTQPFHNGYAVAAGPTSISTSGVLGTSIGSIMQNFAIAGGASINGQASRIETMSFALSLAELDRWRNNGENTSELCAISDNMDFRGRLGLKEWVTDEALTPVAREGEPLLPEYLYAGYHPKPEGAAGTPKPSAPETPGVPSGSTLTFLSLV